MRTRQRSLAARVAAVVTTVAAGVLVLAGPASAHIEIEETSQPAGAEAVLTFGINHGCEDSATTKIRIKLPENVPTATPNVNEGWTIETVTAKLDQPVDVGEGETVTERVTEVDFTAKTPLPAHERDELKLALTIPRDAAGTTLLFPVVQECVEGRTEWTQIPEPGQDPEELAHPAPSVNVTTAVEGAGGDEEASTTTAADGSTTTQLVVGTLPDPSAPKQDKDDDGNALEVAALVCGIAGIVVGSVALVIARRGRSGRSER